MNGKRWAQRVRRLKRQRNAAWVALHEIAAVIDGSPRAVIVRHILREAVGLDDDREFHRVVSAWELDAVGLRLAGKDGD